ncbi:MAG: hypothetical protein GY752_03125 [bacterium]|nr:hypothetical protein [bacterium]MCP4798914.1 hypothetical protein [bacterium]
MTISKSILGFCLIVLASCSFAQIDPDPDSIGIYFDQEATQVNANVAVGDTVTAYLIATNMSQVGWLAFWECYVVSDASYCEINMYCVSHCGFNLAMIMPSDCFMGWPFTCSPNPDEFPIQSIMILATFSIAVNEEGPHAITVVGPEYGLLPYYRVDDMYQSPDYPLYPSSGSVDLPVAVINGTAPVSSDQCSWGEVKSLFR